ncbi:thioesterase-like superfamily-domain-containing protein [Aspergillus spinulosporus]
MSSNLPLDIARTLADHISVETIGPELFQARFNPERQGNTASYSYGGCALGVGVQAACQTAPEGYNLYSVTGNFLAPVLTDSKVTCSVRRLRDTRTFATRQVEISQVQNATTRICVIMLADFHRKENNSLLEYSSPPDHIYSKPESCLTPQEIGQSKVEQGIISNESLSFYNTLFGLTPRFFETRQAPEGISAHNLHGMVKYQPEPPHQARLPLTAKTSADWFRCRTSLPARSDHYAGLTWMLDAYLSFTPLAHSGMFLDDAAACATLDFAIRFFCDEFDLCDWLLREIKTVAGGEARTYTEGRVWNERGKLVASMSQQSILRPKELKRGGKAVL